MPDDLAGNLAELKKRQEFMGALRDFGAGASVFLNGVLLLASTQAKTSLDVDDLSTVNAAAIKIAFPDAPDGWATRAARYVKFLATYTAKVQADLDSDKLPPNVSDDVL